MMMKTFLIGAILVVAATASDYFEHRNWIDYRLARAENHQEYDDTSTEVDPPPSPSPEKICKKAGLTCYDCKDLYLCTMVGGNWTAKLIKQCEEAGSLTPHCNVDKCSATVEPQCDKRSFLCSEVEGMYPDVSSCKSFHYCVPENDVIKGFDSECSKGWGYNYRTTYCDVKLVNETCTEYAVPVCKELGHNAALKNNPTMYYVCLPYKSSDSLLYPFLYLCPNGLIYKGNFECNVK